ncbi:MAG: HypC/HybG/HupF family hydrogenase formation chaperone [Acidimicrobiales bacterium]
MGGVTTLPAAEEHQPAEGMARAESLAVAALAIARRFAAGATMWCVAPQWPAHGRHVAVEFVHPVIVGKRALPAASVEGEDMVGALRLLVRPGDVLAAISSADDTRTADLMLRSEAWGLTRLWMGAGPRPAVSGGEHVVWVEEADPAVAARSGDMVLLYHLLWELTHVVFEHPGLLEAEPQCSEDVCITCSDEGRVAEVRSVAQGGDAEVLVNGSTETVDVSLVDEVGIGDLLLVHAGVAITRLRGGHRDFDERGHS